MPEETQPDPEQVKSCCSQLYETDMIAKVLGESFHPGGEQLTQKLGEAMGLSKGMNVLDVACGNGQSAITLAKWFEVEVTGIDLSEKNLEKARDKVLRAGFADRVNFQKGDAEKIVFDDNMFDGVITECALCTFPDKQTAVSEMHRVLKKGGRIGITDVLLNGELPPELNNIISMILCISGASSAEGYQELLREGGFHDVKFEDHSYTLDELVKKGQKLLMGWSMVERLFKIDLEKMVGISNEKAKELLVMAMDETKKGTFGYGMFVGTK